METCWTWYVFDIYCAHYVQDTQQKKPDFNISTGADFDGTVTLADGIDDVSAYPRLIEAIMRRGGTDEEIEGLTGGNILRVWRDNEINAAAFAAAGELPVEDIWMERRWSRWDNPLPLMIPSNKKRIKAANYI